MKPSTAGVNTMQIEVLEAMGDRAPKGTPQALSKRVCEVVRSAHLPLLIIDESAAPFGKAIEEIRSWNDEAGARHCAVRQHQGHAAAGSGGRDDAFAQLYRGSPMRMICPLPLQADAIALAEAWASSTTH